MAEVAKSVVRESLSDEDDGCQVEPPEEISLQELIDTELALRVPPPIKSNHCFTSDFLTAEREHSSAGLDNNRPSSPDTVVVPIQSTESTTTTQITTTTTTTGTTARLDVLSMNEKNRNSTNNACSINNSFMNGAKVDNGGHNDLLVIDNNSEENNDWTTVEQVAKEIVGNHDKDIDDDQDDRLVLIDKQIEDHVGNGDAIIIQDGLHYTTTKTEFTEYIETTNTTVIETISSTISQSTSSENLETDSVESSEKKKKKKTTTENGEVTITRTKKTKKSKKTDEKENHISVITNGHDDEYDEPVYSPNSSINENELSNVCVKDLKLTYVNEANKSFSEIKKPSEIPVLPAVPIRELKSSFCKFDQLSKKVLHVRSTDPAKASKTFSQGVTDGTGTSTCKACEKTVFAMEQIKAERAVWHKNCFRCHTCNKQLTVDIYSSHEGELYCKPHFKELFKPKVVIDDEEPASDKPDLGLEELSSLNVKSRFQVFEKQDTPDSSLEKSPTTVSVKRSSSILSKVAKFQKKGMDVGVSDEALNGFVCEESESSEEEDDNDSDETDDKGIVKCRRNKRETPVSFTKIDDVKKNWESQQDMMTRREEMREQRKEELQQIRSRLFMGKQGKMKELYEQAVAESEGKVSKKDIENDIIKSERARVVREKFEKGVAAPSDDEEGDGETKTNTSSKHVEEDMSVFEEGISKKSRSIFLEMDANAVKTQQTAAPITTAPPPRESMIVKKGRETESPEREIYRDPDVVRADDKLEEEETVLKSQTTSRMLSMFRQLEEQKEVIPDGPKPKKCFTPPPDYKGSAGNSEDECDDDDDEEDEDDEEEEEEESVTEDGVVKSSYKVKDEFLEKARNAARAKQLAAKFESWEPEKQSNNNAITMLESEHASIDSTKSLRAKFESLRTETPTKEKARPKVNRFVEPGSISLCASCSNKVYPLEKVETNGKVYHKACFRCRYCKCILRMDSYTLNNDHLYCLPHYKQLFIAKGNYDEGFGSDQHKRKWETAPTTC